MISRWRLYGLGSFFILTSQMASAELPENYQNLSAPEKQILLWNQIQASAFSLNDLPRKNPTLWQMTHILNPCSSKQFLGQTFTHSSDEMPEGRSKLLHTYGSTALIEFQVDPHSSPFTGLFQSGGIGLIRLSLAKQPEGQDDGYIPGFALKVLVDGKASINFHVMNSLDGQGKDRNFFAHPFTNRIEPSKKNSLKFLAWFFSNAIHALPGADQDKPENERALPLIEAAAVQANGELVTEIVFPRRIVFIPNPRIAIASDSQKDFREELLQIDEDTVLYEVNVKRDEESLLEPIGRIIAKSKFIASKYGDEKLFFQHMKRSGISQEK